MSEYLRLISRDAPDDESVKRPSREMLASADLDLCVAQLRTGSDAEARRALEIIFRAYYPSLVEFAATYVRSEDAAEDVVAGCFMWLWERRSTRTPEQGLHAFLFGAVRNRALNVRRDASTHDRSQARVADAAGGWAGTPALAPDEALQHRELSDAVWATVGTLSERERTLLALRWEYGMSWAEVAIVLGISPNAAESLHRRALRALRALFPKGFRS